MIHPFLSTSPRAQPFQNAFLRSLEFRSDEVQQYEDDRLQYYGRRMIPIGLLSENAIKNMRAVQKQQLNGGSSYTKITDPSYEDWLLVELTKWFNESFFEWVNALPCKVCGKDSSTAKSSLVENDVRVEVRDDLSVLFSFELFVKPLPHSKC